MVRKSEMIEATWSEVNFNALEWRIPGERMKMDNPHIVPLSKQALAMFEELKFLAGDSPYVFPKRPPTPDLQNNAELRGAYAGSKRQGFCYL
ncbi:putative phage integrase [Salmonella enterica subsp. enterica serovar Senftenberg str. SS209]|nr:putative phage integrase [Salmonella enterica subsp. enterica serovar Senftenberg str. 423984-1]ESG37308.1 putative phage integrase [Salmonella enterica subsp. enterica serovar Senftenberg str. 423984-2]UEP66978.1 hypothetical protein EBPHDLGC_00005 [Salmonella enterica subsp. enterica serovar Senftenberg]CCF90262.1 putative phage integrase [Salmonella enterica subsp. enterica serovar Senftenberg str. SS209]SUG95732.1 integrase [Salmonella enterica subsp. enterica]BBN79579.1 prophage CP4-57